MKKIELSFIESITYNPVVSKKFHRHHVRQARQAQADKPIPVPLMKKITFKYGLEVPKNWKDIKMIDDDACNTRWKDTVEKKLLH